MIRKTDLLQAEQSRYAVKHFRLVGWSALPRLLKKNTDAIDALGVHMKEVILTDKAPLPGGPYSQGLKVGARVYVAGQRPVDAKTGLIPESFADQTRLVLANVRHVLEAGGASMNDVVKVSVYLADISLFAEFNEIYKTVFQEPYPVRTTISCSLRDILVEVDAIAELA